MESPPWSFTNRKHGTSVTPSPMYTMFSKGTGLTFFLHVAVDGSVVAKVVGPLIDAEQVLGLSRVVNRQGRPNSHAVLVEEKPGGIYLGELGRYGRSFNDLSIA